jgi:hypothetical protein
MVRVHMPKIGIRVLGVLSALMVYSSTMVVGQTLGPWEILGNLKEARHHHRAAYIGGTKILVMGGYLNSKDILGGKATATTVIIDVETGSVTSGPPMAYARVCFAIEYADDGDIIVFGGGGPFPLWRGSMSKR